MKLFKRTGLKKKVVLFTVLIFLISVLLSTLTFYIVYDYMHRKAAVSQLERVRDEKLDGLHRFFDGLDSLAFNVEYSNWAQDICQERILPLQKVGLREDARHFLQSLSVLSDGIQFAIIALNGTRVTSSENYRLDYTRDIAQKAWYGAFLEDGRYMEVAEGTEKGIYQRHPEWDITVYYLIYDYNTLDETGYFVVTIPERNLRAVLDTEYAGFCFGLKHMDGKKIFQNIPEEVNTETGSERIVRAGNGWLTQTSAVQIGSAQWKLFTAYDEGYQTRDSSLFWLPLGGFFLLTAVLLMLGAVIVSRYLTDPILKCAGAMQRIRDGSLGFALENGYEDEIGELIGGFNEMSVSLLSLAERNRVISALQKEAEIKILESQINPHFLFNTLEVINGLIAEDQKQEAREVCETLGRLYHYNLRADKHVRLRDELEYTERYLTVAKYKINDLELYTEAEEGVLELPFMKMVLQPLVENSIRHGFRYRTQECCIFVKISGGDGKIALCVMDNGIGMHEKNLERLREELEEISRDPIHRLPDSAHIGLRNVVQRLYLEYGEEVSVRITSCADHGMRIELEIPLARTQREGEHV